MTRDWLVTLAPIIGIVVNAGLQLTFIHLTRRIGLSIVIGIVGGLVAALGEAAWNAAGDVWSDALAAWVFAAISYLGFSYPYWVFVNLNLTSLRIRTLRELRTIDRGVPLVELMAQYSVEEMLRRRLERLEHGNQIARDGEQWHLKSRGVLVLLDRTLALLRAIILPMSPKNVKVSDHSPR